MSEADDLARRFVALWADYLNALLADPNMAEPLRHWLALATAAPGAATGDATRPPAGTAAAAGASDERDAVLAELARRVDELGERVATLERWRKRSGRAVARPRRGDRPDRD
jgi:hypothetical protein